MPIATARIRRLKSDETGMCSRHPTRTAVSAFVDPKRGNYTLYLCSACQKATKKTLREGHDRNYVKAQCSCPRPRTIRAMPRTLYVAPITCGDCGKPFKEA